MLKYKNFPLLIFLIIFLLFSASFASALEITKYPPVYGLPPITDQSTMGELIGYWFGILTYAAGAIAVISFAVGAVGLIMSADSAEARSNATDRMKGAVLGLVLTVASFIIIQTINPKLATPTLTPLPGVAGVYLTNGSQQKPCPIEDSDTSNLPAGFTTIKYVCDDNNTSGGGTGGENNNNEPPPLLVWTFPEKGLEGGNKDLTKVTVTEVQCGGTADVGGSFKMMFQTPGVYYYVDAGCSQYASGPNTNSDEKIPPPFNNGKVKGVKIINDETENNDYGVLFHKAAGLENAGECSNPITVQSQGQGDCQPVNIEANAADIFRLNNESGASGDGVTFYSEPHGWDAGANAGSSPVKDAEIQLPYWQKTASDLIFDYTNVVQPVMYRSICGTFGRCPGSIQIKGTYLVVVYNGGTGDSSTGTGTGTEGKKATACQTFTKDVTNLYAQPIFANMLEAMGDIYIIPVK